jgi:hypothetical protein
MLNIAIEVIAVILTRKVVKKIVKEAIIIIVKEII